MSRTFRIVTTLAAAFLALFARSSSTAEPARAPVPDIFPAIPEVRAEHGVADVVLHVVLDPVSGYPAFSWNARLGVVPTIRVRPGDAIAMTVSNDMRPFAGRPDDVNVHFHGLTVSPNAPGDDALTTLAHPGETLHYRVVIPPDHEPGLYWYHPHAHGETYYDVTNGMSGAIVVEGIQQHLPALASMRERVIVLRDVPTGPGFVDDDMPMNGMAGMTRPTAIVRSGTGPPCRPEKGLQPTLNRQADAHVGIAPGEAQFFRVVNASAARYYDLSVDDAMLHVVAIDGVPLDAYPGTAAVRTVQHVLVPPAGRAEFVVTAPNHATVLRSSCVDTGPLGDANPAVVLAHLVDPVSASAPAVSSVTPSLPTLRVVGAPLPRNVLSRALPRPAARRTIRFTEDERGFYIDGKAFAMDGPPAIVARSGTVEEWTIENATDESHDFHIHQVHFVTESVNGARVAERNWADTVDVPRRTRTRDGRTVPGRVRLLIDFRDPVVRGTFVYHCHILDHEDRGMMARIRVI
ncbi:MAG TPA: multicopper oxidase family protein [Candidatus Elarobacter sp.]|jgi:FtsP/CotA-like multicopper oxidase with cupredoxin domain|nr:multicopper oxidase family protein [Candidatus Elarobacter sp.]